MKKICFVVSVDFVVRAFLLDHFKELSKYYSITVITNVQSPNFLLELGINAKVISLGIARDISILCDIDILLRLISIFREECFDAVHSLTPKAGMLAMLAGWLCGVPLRVHAFTGQVWANKKGIKRFILMSADRFYGSLATHVIVDSPSQQNFLDAEHVVGKSKSVVFGKGSISGVDLDKFKPNSQVRVHLRNKLRMQERELVFLFLGRLNPDKGVLDLARAFIQANFVNCRLLFVGPDEANMQAKIEALPKFDSTRITFVGYTDQPQGYMATADVLCLPSYREGFGSVIIEAAACGTPTIASRIYGITDAIDENVTGMMHEAGNVADLQEKLEQMANDKTLRERLGKQAYHRAITDFNSEIITQAWCDFYRDVVFKDD